MQDSLGTDRGEADLASYGDGTLQNCKTPPGKLNRCAAIYVTLGAFALQREARPAAAYWHGTLTAAKEDGAHTPYRRNRYHDPASGRFTQEDPIGLAGGLNLYGYANGDPINFSDPFGLMACPPNCGPGMSAAPFLGAGCPAIADHCAVDMSRAAAGVLITVGDALP